MIMKAAKNPELEYLSERARSCRELANASRDGGVAATLRSMADTYDQQASKLLSTDAVPLPRSPSKRTRLRGKK